MSFKSAHSSPLLYLIIFLEGYVVLSVELLAIRLTLPFFGSGVDTIAIIIAGVLLPLAIGYYQGGKFQFASHDEVAAKLRNNFLISLIVLTFGISFIFMTFFFDFLIRDLGIGSRLGLCSLYTALFIAGPVYLLGQTVPLVSHFFRELSLPKATGEILFFSTIGSFLGAVATTVFLMNWIGVPYTALVSLLGLVALIFLTGKPDRLASITAIAFGGLAIVMNSGPVISSLSVVNSNAYSIIQIEEYKPLRYIKINGAFSSTIFKDKRDELPMAYADYIRRDFIRPLNDIEGQADVLVLGAGGFTIGMKNTKDNITYVDIDPDLKEVVEEEFLKSPLGRNKKFVAKPARGFLMSTTKIYDLVVVDIGKGLTGSPEHLVTQEFYQSLKDVLKPDGVIVIHCYLMPFFENEYSRNLHATITSVFSPLSRQIIGRTRAWRVNQEKSSVLYIYKHQDYARPAIYTDHKNRSLMDKDIRIE